MHKHTAIPRAPRHTHVHTETASTDVAAVLRACGFRVTTGRSRLLRLLEDAGTPLSIQEIEKRWRGNVPDTATLYRSLTDLHAAGIVRRVDLGTGAVHFEFTPNRPHHHHIVCIRCGEIEELEQCVLGDIEHTLTLTTKQFASIASHSLEFFGECVACEAQK